ncbi:Dynactin subunit 6 [Trametes pubescens]|uniref:Dynactin subunit 6 n=1 Tax=Trametes pubescens TaxID=154538 RepID=A0A1M2V2L5_TRAPU|nr:Dynactin subunit 6 [Trametes pubescens]
MPPIRDKFTIHSKAVVCQDVELKGDITIGAGTIVHPKATIFAIAGPIVIGSGCIIEEGAIIVNRSVAAFARRSGGRADPSPPGAKK